MPPISLSGVGLFSGKPATLTINPAPSGHGLSICRAGTADAPTPLTINFLSTNRAHTCFPPQVNGRNTTIAPSSDSPFGFATVEHLLSALTGLHIHDALVELDGPEIPILDGSALPFVDSLRPPLPEGGGWGVGSLTSPSRIDARTYILPDVVEVIDPRTHARIRATPRATPGTSYSYLLDYGSASTIPAQAAEFDSARDNYAKDIAPARTFSLLKEAQAMQALGLFTHITPRDMLVLDDQGQPIDNVFRFDNEPARHKLLDLIGDVALLGRPIQADMMAERSGHALTHELVREIVRRTL